jgi:aromatic-L-amino-acid decarboxylase
MSDERISVGAPPVLGDFDTGDVNTAFARMGDYTAGFRQRPVRHPGWRPGQIAAMAAHLPEHGIGMEAVLDGFEKVIAPGLLAWNNPGFLGFFGISAPLPAVAAAVMTTVHNSNRMVRIANPAGPELDYLAGAWLQQFLHVPDCFEPQLFASASQSHAHALAAVLNERTSGRFRSEGLSTIGTHFRLYRSANAHFFGDKNAVLTGLGIDNVAIIDTTEEGAMDPAALDAAIRADLAIGRVPLMVIATVGTTSTNAVDPVEAIADICERHEIQLYIDAAYAGAFAALPEFDWVRAGWERADAICINPHKALMMPLGCSVLFLKDRDALRRTFSTGGAYIPDHIQPDPMDYGALCGSPMNSLAPVFMMQAFGAEGMRQRLRNTISLARECAALIGHDPAFEIVAPHRFATICFRARLAGTASPAATDRFNAYVAEIIARSEQIYLSPTKLDGRIALRLTIGNIDTSAAHIREAYRVIRAATETAGRLLSFRWPERRARHHDSRLGFWSRTPASALPTVNAPEGAII